MLTHELVASLTSQDSSIQITRQPYPYVKTHVSVAGVTAAVLSQFQVLFYYSGAMCTFFVLILQVVQEKQENLKRAMKLMGLKSSCYWISWTTYGTVLNTASCIIFLGMCLSFLCHGTLVLTHGTR